MKKEDSSRQRDILIRLVLTALLLYSLFHLSEAQLQLQRTQALSAALEAERVTLEKEHAALERRLAEGESVEALEARARRELGLVRPGEIIFYFSDEENKD